MRIWILSALLFLSSTASLATFVYANLPEDVLKNEAWACGLNGDTGEFKAILWTTQRSPAGYDSTRAQMSYYHSPAHQDHHQKKLMSL